MGGGGPWTGEGALGKNREEIRGEHQNKVKKKIK
jgi:hypothetical protein